MPSLNPLQGAVHRVSRLCFHSWARLRHARDIEAIQRFCLFVGYPRSGHSIVGALINAHRRAVIAHELNAPEMVLAGCSREDLFTAVLGRAIWFNVRGNRGVYPFQVPGQWQGRFQELRVAGDKRGGAVVRTIMDHPDFLDRLRALIGMPLKLIHVVRNPYDNIAAISIRQDMDLPEAADFYFRHAAVTAELDRTLPPAEWLTLRHEALLADPRAALLSLCEFLDLDAPADYLDDCCSIVFAGPTRTREKVSWTPALLDAVARRSSRVPFLADYSFNGPEPLEYRSQGTQKT